MPAALGHAYLHKCGTISDVREQGVLAMQADKYVRHRLGSRRFQLGRRFMKAVAMSYWPPMLNKGDEVIQNFQTLIQQQETQTPQPQFADTSPGSATSTKGRPRRRCPDGVAARRRLVPGR